MGGWLTCGCPAAAWQVRGKTVYLQYSTRQEIVNSTRSAEQGGNVLLVSLENLAVRVPLCKPYTRPTTHISCPSGQHNAIQRVFRSVGIMEVIS
jgi:hypothetical protein